MQQVLRSGRGSECVSHGDNKHLGSPALHLAPSDTSKACQQRSAVDFRLVCCSSFMAVDAGSRLCDIALRGAESFTLEETKDGAASGILEVVSRNQPTLQRLAERFKTFVGFESRGITRVLPEERQPPSLASDVQVAILWFGANLSCNNIIVGLYGPLLFELGFLDSVFCAVFGAFLGSLSTGYMSIWGPRSGNRTSELCRPRRRKTKSQ